MGKKVFAYNLSGGTARAASETSSEDASTGSVACGIARLFRKTKQQDVWPDLGGSETVWSKRSKTVPEDPDALVTESSKAISVGVQPATSSTSGAVTSSTKKLGRKLSQEADVVPKAERCLRRKLSQEADGAPKVGSPKKMKRKSSSELQEKSPRCRLGDRSRDEAFRDLFGNIVLVRAPSKKALEADLRPWSDLEPSDVEHLSSDEVHHYEKFLRLSTKRGRSERLARLAQLAQRNTLPLHLGGAQPDSAIGCVSAFLALPDVEQQAVGAAELKRLERLAFLTDNEFLSLSERRERLVELIREGRSGAEQVRGTHSLVSLLAAGGRREADVEMTDASAAEDLVEKALHRLQQEPTASQAAPVEDLVEKALRRLQQTSAVDKRAPVEEIVQKALQQLQQQPALEKYVPAEELVEKALHELLGKATFAVGQKVRRRDKGEDWYTGYVTSVDPLKVTVRNDPFGLGHEWDEVRQIPPEVPASPLDSVMKGS